MHSCAEETTAKSDASNTEPNQKTVVADVVSEDNNETLKNNEKSSKNESPEIATETRKLRSCKKAAAVIEEVKKENSETLKVEPPPKKIPRKRSRPKPANKEVDPSERILKRKRIG